MLLFSFSVLHVCMCTTCVIGACREDSLWNWNYRWLGATKWVLGTEPGYWPLSCLSSTSPLSEKLWSVWRVLNSGGPRSGQWRTELGHLSCFHHLLKFKLQTCRAPLRGDAAYALNWPMPEGTVFWLSTLRRRSCEGGLSHLTTSPALKGAVRW